MPRSIIKKCIGYTANGQRLLVVPPPPPPKWTPAQLFGLGLRGWWPADSLTGLAENASVATLPSSGGVTNPLTQTLAGKYPLYVHVNGDSALPALNFDGEDDYMEVTDKTITKNASRLYIAALFKFDEIDTDVAAKSLISFPGNGGGTRFYLATEGVASATKRYAISGRALDASGTTNLFASSGTPVDTNMHVIEGWIDRSSTVRKVRIFLDGTSIMDSTDPTGWPQGAWDDTATASPANVGMRTSAAPKQSIDGNILDMIVMDAIPSDADKLRIQGFLAHKGKIQTSLPVDHPYRAAAPILS